MFWHCNTCGHDNEEMDTTCLLCGSPKPVTVAPEKIPVCSLTATRAKAECNYADVTVPSKYNVIGEDAFKGRTDLYTVRIHSGVTKILRGAFDGCTNLYAVYVEGKLTSIGPRAFAGCKYLSPDKRPTAGTVASDAFVGCSNIDLGIPTRSVASSTAARTASRPSSTSRGTSGSSARPAPSSFGTSSFSKTAGGSSSGTSFTKTTPPPKPTPPPPPPPPKSTTPLRTTPTPSPAPSPSYTPTPMSLDAYAAFGYCFLIAALSFVVAFLVADWGIPATWGTWQVAIGLALVALVGMFSHFLCYDENYSGISILMTVATALASLNWLFKGGMTEMSMILSVGCAILCLIFTVVAFDECEDGAGGWLLLLTLLNIANVVVGMIVYNYNITGQLWQILVALAILLFVAIGVHVGCTDYDYSINIGISIMALIVAGCFLWWFGGMLVHFVSLLSLGFVGLSIVSAVSAAKEEEDGICVGASIIALAHLVIFFVANFAVA